LSSHSVVDITVTGVESPLKLPSTAVRYRDVPLCHWDDSWPAKQIHIFRVAVGLSWIMFGDDGARIGPKTLP